MSGTSDKIKGRVKEAVGALTDDQRLKREGKLDQATGKIKKSVERVVDKTKNAVKWASEKIAHSSSYHHMLIADEGASKEVPRMPNPNDKCPCGSGKAYKDCCGKSK